MGDIVEDLVIRDRRHLSEDGIVLPIVAINKLTGDVESLEIITRALALTSIATEITPQSRDVIAKTLEGSSSEEMRDYGVVKEKIRQDLKRFIVKSTARRPMILPVILEI